VFRHGDRAPMAGSTSRESESYYFRGKEQLTDKGLQQAYQLGLSLRRRYVDNGFLDARFLPSQVVFRSSPVERCLMTASAVASAMFNITEDGRPIAVPIFTVPKKDDFVCVPRLECPFVVREMAETLGVSKPLPTMHDAGLAVPQWFDDEARKEADHLLDLHDATISALLDSLGILKEALAPQGRPDFTAAIAFEVWRNDSGHYVKIFYRRGSSNDEFNEMMTSRLSCVGEEKCPLDEITKALEKFGSDAPQLLCE
ncbi:histidine acid phosphatase, partial [Teladorsagia circumcincta]